MRWILPVVLVSLLVGSETVRAEELSEKEKARKALVERCDKLNLRAKTEFVEESSADFLKLPEHPISGEFGVAQTPPTVRLQILPDLVPEFFFGKDQYMACWANWARVIRSPDGRFFFAASDHLKFRLNEYVVIEI